MKKTITQKKNAPVVQYLALAPIVSWILSYEMAIKLQA